MVSVIQGTAYQALEILVMKDSTDSDMDATRIQSQTRSTKTRFRKEPHNTDTQSATTGRGELGRGSIINNRFVIEKVLGSGGMGIVYRALDRRKQEARDRNPYIAIKVLSEEFKHHPEAFVALQRESRKSQALAHPNIITVYDFDRDGEIVYMTMEELDGVGLDHHIKTNPTGVTPSTGKKIVESLGQALSYAHSKHIVHSDLKPGNIFLTRDGTVKVLDFGIARAVSHIEAGSSDHTLFDAGELGGLTPAYASLEMFEGENPHPKDDLYALGIISYELLTGHHPYKRKPANQLTRGDLKPGKIESLKRHQWNAIAQSLELKRADRPASIEEFLKKFSGSRNGSKSLAGALVLTTLVLGCYAIFSAREIGPDIDLKDLPIATQEKVALALSKGQEALDFGDMNGALYQFHNAYELHNKNPEAVTGLDSVVNNVIGGVDLDASMQELEQFTLQIDTLLQYPSLAEHRDLLKMQRKLTEKKEL